MKGIKEISLLLPLILLFNIIVLAQGKVVVYSDNNQHKNISPIKVLEDPNNSLTIDQVISSQEFKLTSQEIPNLGISKSAFWLKFEILNNTTNSNLNLILEQPNIDLVELYKISSTEKHQKVRKGEHEDFYHKNYQHPNYIFDVNIPKNESRIFFLKVKANEPLFLPLFISSIKTTITYISKQDTLFSFYAGIILVMLLYNIFIYFTVRDNSYLYYVFYILFILLTQIALKGYHFKYLMPDFPVWANKSVTLFPSIAGIAAIEFIKNFLRTKDKVPVLNKVGTVLEFVFLLSIGLLLFDYPIKSFKIMQTNTMLLSIYALYIGYKIMKLGYRPAKFFLLAWTILWIGAFIFVLKDYGVLPYNNFTNYTLPAGSAIEVVLLSFALADRINILKEEKEIAQAEELKQRREKQQILLKQADTLKHKVKRATSALQNKTDKLEAAYLRLEAAELELIQREKISALGLMAAGTSHEFNNANTNIQLAVDILELNTGLQLNYVGKLHDILPKAKNIETELNDLETYKKEIDFKSIEGDIKDALEKANSGLEKIAVNTKKLKDFSKIDNEGWVSTNVNEDLINLTDLWKSNLGAIKLNLELNENLPRLDCNAQKINDCFKSVLQNSIESIKEKNSPDNEGLITIRTGLIAARIVISFEDNGTGMKKEIQENAFDMYFTTKGAKKTGVSLTIVKSTLIAHNGHVEMDSKADKGTTVRLIIPVQKLNKK